MVNSIIGEMKDMSLLVVFRHAQPLSIAGKPMALTRALRNLIINAAVHGGGAEVSVEPWRDQALIVIDDNGPGIPEDRMDQVFEPFFRVDLARRHSVPGAGLGLAIAREIIIRAGGELSLSNRKEGGLRQQVKLPFSA